MAAFKRRTWVYTVGGSCGEMSKDKMWIDELIGYEGISGKFYPLPEYQIYEQDRVIKGVLYKSIPKNEYPLKGVHRRVYK